MNRSDSSCRALSFGIDDNGVLFIVPLVSQKPLIICTCPNIDRMICVS